MFFSKAEKWWALLLFIYRNGTYVAITDGFDLEDLTALSDLVERLVYSLEEDKNLGYGT